jgi:hypothetical protein
LRVQIRSITSKDGRYRAVLTDGGGEDVTAAFNSQLAPLLDSQGPGSVLRVCLHGTEQLDAGVAFAGLCVQVTDFTLNTIAEQGLVLIVAALEVVSTIKAEPGAVSLSPASAACKRVYVFMLSWPSCWPSL